MKDKKILLLGGGGHCKSVLDTLYKISLYDEIGVIDIPQAIDSKILDTKIIGSDNDLQSLYEEGYQNAFITVGSIGNPSLRIKLYHQLEKIGFHIPNVIDPSAIVSPYIKIGSGNFIGKNAIVNADAIIENGTIINTSSIVEHDCKVGSFAHLSPNSLICGNVTVGENVHIGASATVIQNVEIIDNAIIGAGSVVVQSISEEGIYYGVPASKKH